MFIHPIDRRCNITQHVYTACSLSIYDTYISWDVPWTILMMGGLDLFKIIQLWNVYCNQRYMTTVSRWFNTHWCIMKSCYNSVYILPYYWIYMQNYFQFVWSSGELGPSPGKHHLLAYYSAILTNSRDWNPDNADSAIHTEL